MPSTVNATPFSHLHTSANCLICPAAGACLTVGLAHDNVVQWNALVQEQRSLPAAGRRLFEAGSALDAIYVVRAGCIKSVAIDADGQERVRAFHLPGDIIGLDALQTQRHTATAITVTASQVCKVPQAQVRNALLQNPALTLRLIERMSHDLATALTLTGDYTAEQRIAAFLLTMQQRTKAGDSLRLPMGRRDIANYLRLATETVCRVLTRLSARGVIATDDRRVHLLKKTELQAMAAAFGINAPAPLAMAA